MGGTAIRLAVGLTVAALATAGCSQHASRPDNTSVDIVASTDVWGSVASAVAGEYASVKSIESVIGQNGKSCCCSAPIK